MRKMFCEVRLPRTVTGQLFLHSMPGRYEPLDHTWEHVKAQRIAAIVCLAGNDEISVKSHAYYRRSFVVERGRTEGSAAAETLGSGSGRAGIPAGRGDW